MKNIKISPLEVAEEYRKGTAFKENLGFRGISRQAKMNERFYVGDQWYGVNCGNDRPLVRRNVIKRIGEQKLSVISTSPVAVNFSAEGIPNNASMAEAVKSFGKNILSGGDIEGGISDAEISFMTDALSSYFKITAERVGLEAKKETALRKCYISGTAIAYTYWDNSIKTGLFADNAATAAINGDINFEILDIENVVFGDTECEDIERQPYIIISQRLDCDEVRRSAEKHGLSPQDTKKILPDGENYLNESNDQNKVTVFTKFFKVWDNGTEDYCVMCEQVTENAFVRPPFCIGIKVYPFAKMCWLEKSGSPYGESEITYTIPNQIAINRALSAAVWNLMKTGMPITVVNGDIVTEPITNTPGQIIKVFGDSEDTASAIHHVKPPEFSNQFVSFVESLAVNTLSDAGANDAALGQLRPDNAAAILQVREAALQPLHIYQNRFYNFIEDIARIWAEFWVSLYGDRKIRFEAEDGVYYIPFHADRYKNLLLKAKIDVGANPVWDISSTVAMLDGMLEKEVITKLQYLERIPNGIVPELKRLIKEVKNTEMEEMIT